MQPFRDVDAIVIPPDASLRSYDAALAGDESAVVTGSETIVEQAPRDEVDINTIMRRFGATGEMPFGRREGVYGDFSGVGDFDSALAKVEDARARFMRLPAEVRDKFANDPGVMIRAAQSMTEQDFDALFVPPVAVAPAVPVVAGGVVPPPPVTS